MSAPIKIVTSVPSTAEDLAVRLTEINHKPVATSLSEDGVLCVDVYNWQGSLFVRRNRTGHLIYNIGLQCADYKSAPLTASNLNDALGLLLIDIHRPGVVHEDVLLGMSMNIQEFARKRL